MRPAIVALLTLAFTAAAGASPVRVSVTKQSDWGAGMVVEIKLRNTGSDDVKDWALQFDLPAGIEGMWGAKVRQHDGDTYVLAPEDYSRMIRPGGEVVIGFHAAPGGVDPTNLVFQPVIAGDRPPDAPAESTADGVVQRPVFGGGTDVRAEASDGTEVDFRVLSDWGSGFQAEVVLRNRTDKPIKNWTLSFSLPVRITGMWNAHVAGISGTTFLIDAATQPWNRDIPPGGEVRFGFTGAPGALVGRPQNIAVNEAPVAEETVVEQRPDGVLAIIPAPPPVPTPAPPPATLDYAEALRLSFLFYDAQRSGRLPDERVPWRGDSALEDGADAGVDLTGGFFDAGDGMKFALPMAASMTLLSWGGIEFHSGYGRAGEWDNLLRTMRWGADWLMRAHPEPNVFYAQVGRGDLDHAFWGPPEQMQMLRPSFRVDADNPGSDVAGEAAAALASAAILFRKADPAFSAECLRHARELFDFAWNHRGAYSDAIPDVRAYYNSFTGYYDELAWAAAWLYRATGDPDFLERAKVIYAEHLAAGEWNWTHSWDDKKYGTAVLLAALTGEKRYARDVSQWLAYWTVGRGGQRVQTTPGGLAWLDQWGSLRYAANTAFLALVASRIPDMPDAAQDREFATRQINYMLGANPPRRSYVVGYGFNSPRNPHHRAAHGSETNDISNPTENRHVLFGALVGGPSAPDDFAYVDDRSNYITNEVALDYNAAFTGALAALAESE